METASIAFAQTPLPILDERMGAFVMVEFVSYKRWRLKDGKQEAELVELVRNEIVPHYAKLEGPVRLALHRIKDTPSYLALQHWQSRAAWETTTSTDFYQSWLGEYEPILSRWDQLMEFEDGWEAEVILG
jgi:quinol monooxygenase YgiN